ncbi:PEP-CTERM sorting domain-containing protein [uncultured Sphingomonas sp.]|uniref:PEP-CTERM sorting domain-containing protein n=1 Tax=uncultured Sphingomonas sp. TaxID=158754 RepID=UPI0035C9A71F
MSSRRGMVRTIESSSRYACAVMGAGGKPQAFRCCQSRDWRSSQYHSRQCDFDTCALCVGADEAGAGDETLLVSIAAATPEPGTWAMMIAALGLAGRMLRRQRAVRSKTVAVTCA